MKEPFIKIELVDGTHTWITVCPIHQLDSIGARYAAGEAFVGFLTNLARQGEEVFSSLQRFREP